MSRLVAGLAALSVLAASTSGCSSCGRKDGSDRGPGGAPSSGVSGARTTGAAATGGPAGGEGSAAGGGEAVGAAQSDGGDPTAGEPVGAGDEALCRTLALDFFDGQAFDEARVAKLLPGDALAIRRAGDDVHLCRAISASDDKLCDRTREPFGCRIQRALFLDSRRDLKDPAWGALLVEVMSSGPGADPAKVSAAREALRTGDPSRCPREWDACPALASGDARRCPEEQKGSGECARDAPRMKLLRSGGLDALGVVPHDKVLADATLGRGSCRGLVDQFLLVCQRATANSQERLRKRAPVVGPSKEQAAATPPPVPRGGAPLPAPPPALPPRPGLPAPPPPPAAPSR